jgi:RimJ/RimL family protein N-acetyltransferase
VGSMIGDLNLFVDEGVGDINIMIAEPSYRQLGLATECIAHLELVAKNLRLHTLSAKIQTDNEPSLRLFVKLGYQKIREVPVFNETHFEKAVDAT